MNVQCFTIRQSVKLLLTINSSFLIKAAVLQLRPLFVKKQKSKYCFFLRVNVNVQCSLLPHAVTSSAMSSIHAVRRPAASRKRQILL